MTPGEANLKVVGDGLGIVETCLREMRDLPIGSLEEFLADRRNALAAESLLRRALQAAFDVLRHLAAKRFGHGALEYKELARLAVREQIVRNPRLGGTLLQMAGFRNRLVHYYQEVTPEELYGVLRSDLGDLEALVGALQAAAAPPPA
jgi:uncharacterized protein YutE (UPF0331/DUF86 family)